MACRKFRGARKREEEVVILRQLWDNKSKKGDEAEDQEEKERIERENSEKYWRVGWHELQTVLD